MQTNVYPMSKCCFVQQSREVEHSRGSTSVPWCWCYNCCTHSAESPFSRLGIEHRHSRTLQLNYLSLQKTPPKGFCRCYRKVVNSAFSSYYFVTQGEQKEEINMDEGQYCNKTGIQNNMLKPYPLNQYTWQASIRYSNPVSPLRAQVDVGTQPFMELQLNKKKACKCKLLTKVLFHIRSSE